MKGHAVLAVAPDASGTGAPRLLASLLAESEAQGRLDRRGTRVVLGAGGPTLAALEAVAEVRVLGRPYDAVRRAAHLLPATTPRADALGVAAGLAVRPSRHDPGAADLVWANGAGGLRLAAALPRRALRAPLVAHVHELGVGLRRALAGDDPRRLLGRAAVVVAVSDAVRSHLVDELGVAGHRVVVHRGWVPGPTAPVAPTRPAGVPAEALVVAGCGAAGWRKGTDLFLDLARDLPPRVGGRPVHLAWIGGEARPGDLHRLRADIALRGLGERVHLVGEVPDAGPWLAGADVLALTSREDPFPLVVLEAGARGVPVVAFRSGGVTEALPPADHDACLAPLFDGAGLAARVEAVLADGERAAALGRALRSRVEAHHRAGPCVAALWEDLERRLDGSGARPSPART